MTISIDKVILDAMARTLWVWAWGNLNGDEGAPEMPIWDDVETRGGNRPPDRYVVVPFEDWDDAVKMYNHGHGEWHAWTTPAGAYEAARALTSLYERHQDPEVYGPRTTLSSLLTIALITDQDQDELDVENAAYFGQMLAEMALGVETEDSVRRTLLWDKGLRSWFTNHKEFPLEAPLFTCQLVRNGRADLWGFAQHELRWSCAIGTSAIEGGMVTSIFGDEPRIEIGDAEPEWLGEDIDRLTATHGTAGDVVVDHLFDLFTQSQGNARFNVQTFQGRDATNHFLEVENRDRHYLVFGVSDAEMQKAHEIVQDTIDANDTLRHWGKLIYINEGDRTSWKQTFVLWAGMYSSNRLVVYANSLQDAFDEMIDYISEHEPGLLVDTEVNEEYTRLVAEFTAEHGREPEEEEGYKIMEEAEEDTSSGGNAGERINSEEWGIVAEDPSAEQLAELARR